MHKDDEFGQKLNVNDSWSWLLFKVVIYGYFGNNW